MPDIISGKEIRSYHFKYKYVKFTLDLRIGNPRGFSGKKRRYCCSKYPGQASFAFTVERI